MYRRDILIAAGTAAATGMPAMRMASAAPWQPDLTDFDMMLGDAAAPVTVIEYASFTCPHCAAFHSQILPEVKEKLIDSSQMNLVFRDFPLDGVALRAGMLARYLPKDAYFPFIDILFSQQATWTRAGDPIEELRKYGRLSGLSDETMDICLADEALADKIIALRQEAEATYNVAATPSFVIDDTLREGGLSYDALARFVEEAASA